MLTIVCIMVNYMLNHREIKILLTINHKAEALSHLKVLKAIYINHTSRKHKMLIYLKIMEHSHKDLLKFKLLINLTNNLNNHNNNHHNNNKPLPLEEMLLLLKIINIIHKFNQKLI